MKLTPSKLTETLRKLADGKTVYQARKTAGISTRRYWQLTKKKAIRLKGVKLWIERHLSRVDGRPIKSPDGTRDLTKEELNSFINEAIRKIDSDFKKNPN